MPQSPYLDRLRNAIDQAVDSSTRGMRRAELAGCLARLGDFDAAEGEITSLRSEFGDGRSGRVSIMIMCAEAQIIYYRSLGEQARDRMMRAQLLSIAGRDAGLSALTSAWLAHICFNLHRHEEMARAAKTCSDTISKEDHDAASRFALTLGDAFYACEEMDVGNRWYAKAHEHAVKLGDHATIGALTYNRAAMGTFMARVRAVESEVGTDVVSRLASEVRTAINYQAIAQLTSLQPLLDYTQASVQVLAGRYSDATELLSKMMESGQSTSPIDRMSVLQSDLVLCLAKSGLVEEARAKFLSMSLEELAECTPDDQVVALGALIEAARLCGLESARSVLTAKLDPARLAHREAVRALRSSLIPFSDAAALARV